jgi:GAF domain-containing protein
MQTIQNSEEKRRKQVDALHRISQILSYDLGLPEMLQFIAGMAADASESKVVSILLYDQGSQSFSAAATHSFCDGQPGQQRAVRIDHSVSGRALSEKKAQVIADLRSWADYDDTESATMTGMQSLCSLPMLIHGEALGVLNSYSPSKGAFDENDAKILSIIASLSAIVVENARLHAATAAIAQDLENRKLLDRAKSSLMRKHKMDEPTAYRWLQKESMKRSRPMREIAEAVLIRAE